MRHIGSINLEGKKNKKRNIITDVKDQCFLTSSVRPILMPKYKKKLGKLR